MVTAAWGGAGDADAVALLIDARQAESTTRSEAILSKLLGELRAPKILVLNKIDTDRARAAARRSPPT
jgi:GTP-binding protein Era